MKKNKFTAAIADLSKEFGIESIKKDGYCRNGVDCGCTMDSHKTCFIPYEQKPIQEDQEPGKNGKKVNRWWFYNKKGKKP